jgi:NAD(P)H dehydrogenase (quinone)
LLRVPGGDPENRVHPDASFADLEWADGIGFGTPIAPGCPAAELTGFLESTEPLWSRAALFDKAVSVFTDEPERFAPDLVVKPLYDALYHWGAVIIGPRAFELEFDARPVSGDSERHGSLSGPRWRTAHYRGRRLAALASTLANERGRRMRLEL